MRDKTIAIAAALGGTLNFAQYDGAEQTTADGDVTLPDGVSIYLRHGGYGNEGRYSVSGNYPSHADSWGSRKVVIPRDIWIDGKQQESHSITVADSKTADQIAKDIKRRLLPALSPIWHACKAYCTRNERYRDQRKATIERAAKATSGEAQITPDKASIDYGYELGRAVYRGGYSDTDPEHFRVEFNNVTEAQLSKLLAVMRDTA